MDENKNRHFSLCKTNLDKTDAEKKEDAHFLHEISSDPDYVLKKFILQKTGMSLQKLDKLIAIIQKTEKCTKEDALLLIFKWNEKHWHLS